MSTLVMRVLATHSLAVDALVVYCHGVLCGVVVDDHLARTDKYHRTDTAGVKPADMNVRHDLVRIRDIQEHNVCDVFLYDTRDKREIPFITHPADDRFLGWSLDGKAGGLRFPTASSPPERALRESVLATELLEIDMAGMSMRLRAEFHRTGFNPLSITGFE